MLAPWTLLSGTGNETHLDGKPNVMQQELCLQIFINHERFANIFYSSNYTKNCVIPSNLLNPDEVIDMNPADVIYCFPLTDKCFF